MSNEHLKIYVSYMKTIVLMSRYYAWHKNLVAMVTFRAQAGERAKTTYFFTKNIMQTWLLSSIVITENQNTQN